MIIPEGIDYQADIRTYLINGRMTEVMADQMIEGSARQAYRAGVAAEARLAEVRRYAEDVGLTRVLELLDAPAAAPRVG